MALVLETGAGLANANAYVTVATVETYFSLRGLTEWADLDATEKESAIIRATFALDAKYDNSWSGIKGSATQALAWPRIRKLLSTKGILDKNGYELSISAIPTQLANVVCEVALIESTERFLVQGISRDDMPSSESVGPISTSWTDKVPTVKQYPHIDSMLLGLAGAASGTNMVISLTADEIDQNPASNMFDYPAYFNLIKYD
jgi:hypothetical protein